MTCMQKASGSVCSSPVSQVLSPETPVVLHQRCRCFMHVSHSVTRSIRHLLEWADNSASFLEPENVSWKRSLWRCNYVLTILRRGEHFGLFRWDLDPVVSIQIGERQKRRHIWNRCMIVGQRESSVALGRGTPEPGRGEQ